MGTGGRRITSLLVVAALAVGLSGCTVRVGTGSAAPSSTAAATVPPSPTPSPTATTITVPLDVVHQGRATLAIVPVTIDGHGPYPFILDTGASTSGINRVLAQHLHLPRTGRTATVSGVVSSAKIPLVHVASWSVHGVPLPATDLGALSFAAGSSGTTTQRGHSVAGLLGSDQLSRFGSITVDYVHQQLRFTPGR